MLLGGANVRCDEPSENALPVITPIRDSDGRFHNPWPDSEPREFSDVLRWTLQRRRQSRAKDPPRNSFPTATPEIANPARTDASTATWIGHSTVLLQLDGMSILTDPMFGARASPFKFAGPRRLMDPALSIAQLPSIDVVLLSHNHYDHLDAGSVTALASKQSDATWVVPLQLGDFLRGLGPRKVVELNWGQQTTVNGLRVTATPARHFSARWFRDRNTTLWSGFALERNGTRVFFAGDTAYHPAFKEIGAECGPFDFVMIPIGAYDPRWFMNVVHADPEEAVQIYQDLIAAPPESPLPLMLAIHWGTFRLTDEPMDEPPRRTVARWRALGLREDRLWIAKFGETRGISRR
jgi:N-acyl-phosphatidylethanolamine-hydrolysing phospholipase D